PSSGTPVLWLRTRWRFIVWLSPGHEDPHLARPDVEALAGVRLQCLEVFARRLHLDEAALPVLQLELDDRACRVDVTQHGPEAAPPLLASQLQLVRASEALRLPRRGLDMIGIVHGERAEMGPPGFDTPMEDVDVAEEAHDEGRGRVVEDLLRRT